MAEPPLALSSVRHILVAVVSTIVPEAAALDEQGWNRLVGLVEGALLGRPEVLKWQLRLYLRGVQWLPVFRYAMPFTALNQANRSRFLTHLENHPVQIIRIGFSGLHALAVIGYYGQPDVARAVGYSASPRGWKAFE